MCAGQSRHVDSKIAAAAVLYLPCEHSEHGAEPFTSLYVPAMHASHCIPSGPVYPLLQVQLVTIGLPSGECVYAGHWLHVDSSISGISAQSAVSHKPSVRTQGWLFEAGFPISIFQYRAAAVYDDT